jgi:hypothetical protein
MSTRHAGARWCVARSYAAPASRRQLEQPGRRLRYRPPILRSRSIMIAWIAGCAAAPPAEVPAPVAHRAAAPDEVHVVVAPAFGFTGETDEPVRWRLERSGSRATLAITSHAHGERRFAGTVAIRGAARRYELADGEARFALSCDRGPVRVHPVNARLVPRAAAAGCDGEASWQPADEVTIDALQCKLEPRSATAPRARNLTFAPPPGFDAVEDQCCTGDSCVVRWDIRLR